MLRLTGLNDIYSSAHSLFSLIARRQIPSRLGLTSDTHVIPSQRFIHRTESFALGHPNFAIAFRY